MWNDSGSPSDVATGSGRPVAATASAASTAGPRPSGSSRVTGRTRCRRGGRDRRVRLGCRLRRTAAPSARLDAHRADAEPSWRSCGADPERRRAPRRAAPPPRPATSAPLRARTRWCSERRSARRGSSPRPHRPGRRPRRRGRVRVARRARLKQCRSDCRVTHRWAGHRSSSTPIAVAKARQRPRRPRLDRADGDTDRVCGLRLGQPDDVAVDQHLAVVVAEGRERVEQMSRVHRERRQLVRSRRRYDGQPRRDGPRGACAGRVPVASSSPRWRRSATATGRTGASPRNRPSARYAFTNASCTTSRASSFDPSTAPPAGGPPLDVGGPTHRTPRRHRCGRERRARRRSFLARAGGSSR